MPASHLKKRPTKDDLKKIYDKETSSIREKMFQNFKNAYEEYHKMSDDEQLSMKGLALKFQIRGSHLDENVIAEYHQRMEKERQERENEYGGGAIPKRYRSQEGGALLVPPEQEGIPTDTYTPKEQVNAEANQLPDTKMEEEYLDFILDEALDDDEEDYLMSALEADQRLDDIFEKVVETASEFSGEGEVKGPGTGVSDSIPARLSDGEFVITKKATDQIGANNLQSIMDEAERAYDGGLQKYALGGTAEDDEDEKSLLGKKDEEEIKKQMITANRMPSVI